MNYLNSRWVVILLTLPHFNIYFYGLELIRPVNFLMQLLIILVAFFIVLYKPISVFNLIFIFLIITILVSSAFNGTITIGILFTFIVLLCFCIYISYAMTNFKELITGLFYIFTPLLILNFATILVGGIETSSSGVPYFLLGSKNHIAFSIIPALVIINLYYHLFFRRVKISNIILNIIAVVSLFISQSATAIIVGILILIFIVFYKYKPKMKLLLSIFVGVYILIILYRIQERVFGRLIEDYLGKDITFTNRTYIWDYILAEISNFWVIGLGRGNSLINSEFSRWNEAHNGILELLLDTGVIGLVLFMLLLIILSNHVKSINNSFVVQILSFSIFLFLIIGLTESVYYKVEFWLLIFMLSKVKSIKRERYNIENDKKSFN